ncbi:MAG: ATP synthase F1 subunit delta [Acidobacteria bacterium]|nr:ATP synthase F1 subunit delta [Acidobacteriota bacterium]
MSSAVLSRYARSLADIVFEKKIEGKVTKDLQTWREIFLTCPELLEAFDAPQVPEDSKERVLDELLVRYPAHPVTSNFLRIMLQRNRIRFFNQILENYLKLVNHRNGIVTASVTTVAPIPEEEAKRLTETLSRITGKKVNVDLKTDESLIGGVVIQMGSTIFDGSIRTQLAEMKRRLVES